MAENNNMEKKCFYFNLHFNRPGCDYTTFSSIFSGYLYKHYTGCNFNKLFYIDQEIEYSQIEDYFVKVCSDYSSEKYRILESKQDEEDASDYEVSILFIHEDDVTTPFHQLKFNSDTDEAGIREIVHEMLDTLFPGAFHKPVVLK